jgi:hypothetical protein
LNPIIRLDYKKFDFTASYMWAPDYDFGRTIATGFLPDGTPNTFTADLTATRQEADFTVGYWPLDWLGIAIGYKGIFRGYKFENTQQLFPPFANVGTFKVDTYYQGPVFGVRGDAKINDSFALLGNVFGGYLFTSCSSNQSNNPCRQVSDGTYAASRLTLRYAPKSPSGLSLTLGYRFQIINTDIDSL